MRGDHPKHRPWARNAILSLALILLTLTSIGAPHTFGLSAGQQKLFDANVYYFDEAIGCTPSTANSSGCICTLNYGGDYTNAAFGYFLNHGFPAHQAAGIVGNLIAESGVIPNRRQGPGMQTINSFDEVLLEENANLGYGIAQWTTAGRKQSWKQFADDNNRDPLSLDLELDFLMHELETKPAYGLAELKLAPDIRQATWIFLSFFERPATVVNAGMQTTVNQPTSGPAFDTLNARTSLAEGTGGDYDAGDATYSCSTLTGDTSTPNFSANPDVTVNGSPPGPHKDSNCSPTRDLTPGALSLKKVFMERWDDITSIGGFSCRPINFIEGNPTSIHGTGRALDIMISVGVTEPDGTLTGDLIRNWLINNSTTLGVQRVIWNRYTWSADRDGWRPYGAASYSPHTDHIHAEINIEASQNDSLGR